MSSGINTSRSDQNREASLFAVIVATIMVGQQVASRALRDGFFLTHFDASALPSVMIGASLLSVAIVLGSARLLRRVTPARSLPVFFIVNSLLFVAEWALSGPAPEVAAVVLYLHTTSIGAVVLSGFWSVVNERFDPFTAKQLVGRIGSGASLGGVLGGLAAWGGASVLDIPSMILVMAVLSGSCIVLVRRIGGPTTAPREDAGARISVIEILQETPFLQHLAVLVGLVAFAEAAFDYVFKSLAADYFSGSQELVSFFALFYLFLGVGTLLMQNLFTRRSLMLMGLAFTISTLPAAIVGLGLLALLIPGMLTATAMRGGISIVGNSLYSSGYELLYTPVLVEKKRPTKTLLDVGGDNLGAAAGAGFAFFVLGIFPGIANPILVSVGVLAGATALIVARRLHKGYISSLEESLRSGALDATKLEAVDATTRETVSHTIVDLERSALLESAGIASLGRDELLERIREQSGRKHAAAPRRPLIGVAHSSFDATEIDDTVAAILDLRSRDPERIRRALATNSPLDRELVAHAVALLGDSHVAEEAAVALGRVAPIHTGLLLDAALQSRVGIPVRRGLCDILGSLPTQRSADGLVYLLAADEFELRFHAATGLLQIHQQNPKLRLPAEQIFDSAEREAQDARRRWSFLTAVEGKLMQGDPLESAQGKRTLQSIAYVFTLLLTVLDRESLQLAIRALTVQDAGQRGTGLEYLDNVLPPKLKDALWPLLEDRRFALGAVRERSEILAELVDSAPPKASDLTALRERIDASRATRS
jgi:hypothetical protein